MSLIKFVFIQVEIINICEIKLTILNYNNLELKQIYILETFQHRGQRNGGRNRGNNYSGQRRGKEDARMVV